MIFPVIAEFYMISAIVGALVLVASALFGGFGHGHMGARGGHLGGGHGHAGHLAGGHALHQAGAHAGTGQPGAAGHAAPTGAHQSAASGHHAESGQAGAHHQGAQSSGHNASARGASNSAQNNAGTLAASSSRLPAATFGNQGALLLLITLFNPTTISSFAVWFGAFGLFAWRLLPFLPISYTLPIALVAGFLGTRFTLHMMSTLVSGMYTSGSFRQEHLIGSAAEVTVSVDSGRTGEVSCIAAGSRYSFSARSAHPEQTFKRGSQVIISDVQNDIAYIEPWPDQDFPLDDKDRSAADAATAEPAKLPETPN